MTDRKCVCAGGRQFEPLDEPKENGMRWHVCPCCGARKQFGNFPEPQEQEVQE